LTKKIASLRVMHRLEEYVKSRRFWIILAVPVLVILALLASVLFAQLLVVDLVIPVPQFPGEVQIFKMVNPAVTAEYVSELGEKLGLSGDLKKYATGYGLQDEAKRATLNVRLADGRIEYDTSPQPSLASPGLPAPEAAVTLATGFLSQAGLLKAGMKPYQVSIGETAGGIPQTLCVSFTSQVDVTRIIFPGDQRDYVNDMFFPGGEIVEIDNILLPGGRSSVIIGNTGKVTRMTFRPIQCIPAQTISTKPIDQAYRELKAEINRTRNDIIDPLDRFKRTHFISIGSIAISYCLESPDMNLEWVYPIYVFKGQARVFWQGSARPYRNMVSATDLFSLPRLIRY
jgi:hypothetical protein